MNTRYGRYGAAYNMIGFCCFNEELLLLPKNPTEAKLQATSTRGESTEPTFFIISSLFGCRNCTFLLSFSQTDKICMMTTRLACNRAIESSYWRMDNNSDVGLLTGYVLYRLLIELESMDLDTFSC
jgi:hypothetical protein